MPKAPTCRKCGNTHWSHQSCPKVLTTETPEELAAALGLPKALALEWKGKEPGKTRRPAAGSARGVTPPEKSSDEARPGAAKKGNKAASHRQSERPPHPKSKNKKPMKRGRDRDTYNAYQREYQAKRRAEDRELREKYLKEPKP